MVPLRQFMFSPSGSGGEMVNIGRGVRPCPVP